LEVKDFVHPFDDAPWSWKVYFRAKRLLYLVAVFLPCVTVASIAQITGREDLRAYGLDLLVRAFESAGCGLMKFGQWLSMRPDMIPADVIHALSSLRQDTPCHSLEHTRAMIQESFGQDIEVVFEEFNALPVASGTVAQVHRGRLREEYALKADIRLPNGELARDVAVKVRHPNVLAETWCDVDLIYTFIQCTDFLTIPFKKDDFLVKLQRQVDFKREAQNLLQFAENFEKEIKEGSVSFPTVSVGMLSNCVLLESWVGGCSVHEILLKGLNKIETQVHCIEEKVGVGIEKIEKVGEAIGLFVDEVEDEVVGCVGKVADSVSVKQRELAGTLFDVSIKMFLRDNLVHGDLHAGNVMFDTNKNECTIIDAGLTTCLEEDWVRKDFIKFLQALCTGDVDRIVGKMLDFHVELEDPSLNASGVNNINLNSHDNAEREVAVADLRADVQTAVDQWVSPDGSLRANDGGPISLGDLVGELMYSMQRHGVCLRSDVAASLMTMAISEGLIRSLDPEFDLVRKAMPYFIKYGDGTSKWWPPPLFS